MDKADFHQNQKDSLLQELAEVRKAKFLNFVEALARLRELQHGRDTAHSVLGRAKKLPALNLPSNLLRAAAIFVDHAYGFPPNFSTFGHPEWVVSRSLLPEGKRGSLVCEFTDSDVFETDDVVVLITDIPSLGLHAGMAGIVRDVPDEDDGNGLYEIEFGEPEDERSIRAELEAIKFRKPRPGDLLEHYRL